MRAEKPELRRLMKEKRSALSALEAARRSDEACRHLLAWPGLSELAAGSRVCAYAAVRGELDPTLAVEALRARGVELVLARDASTTLPRSPLTLVSVAAGTDLVVSGMLGIPEPPDQCPSVAPASVDLFLLPALAFDDAGHRLGYGRGHFDATLAAAPNALRVVLGYELQRVLECPFEPHDQLCDALATEAGVVETKARSRTHSRERGNS